MSDRAPYAISLMGTVRVVFTVDLFNEGIDVPSVDTLLLLRPTDSATLFLQQLGRGLRKAAGKNVCTVLDFVGTHRKEFRFDRPLRALLGGSRADVERQVRDDFPFLPAGCSFELDPVAREIVLGSIRDAIPSTWRERCAELRSLGDVGLGEYLESTGLELEDVYVGGHSWSEMRRAAGLHTAPAGPARERDAASCRSTAPRRRRRAPRGLPSAAQSRGPARTRWPIAARAAAASNARRVAHDAQAPQRASKTPSTQVWAHPQVRAELLELLELLRARVPYIGAPARPPRTFRSRCTPVTRGPRFLPLSALATGAKPPTWQTGVWWEPRVSDRPLRVHSRQERRRVLADHSLPRLRNQPGSDPLGEPVRDRSR